MTSSESLLRRKKKKRKKVHVHIFPPLLFSSSSAKSSASAVWGAHVSDGRGLGEEEGTHIFGEGKHPNANESRAKRSRLKMEGRLQKMDLKRQHPQNKTTERSTHFQEQHKRIYGRGL